MLEENNLTYEEYMDVAASVGWKTSSKRLIEKSLKNSLTVKYVENGEVIGMARMITDSGYFAFLADVVVKPVHQGKGIGRLMIENLLDRLKKDLEEDESMMVQLLSANGKENFYSKFGFKLKKEVVSAGMYMWMKKD